MIFEALVDECIDERIDAGVEADDHNAGDIGDVAILLILMVVIEHVNDQHREPRDSVHSAYL